MPRIADPPKPEESAVSAEEEQAILESIMPVEDDRTTYDGELSQSLLKDLTDDVVLNRFYTRLLLECAVVQRVARESTKSDREKLAALIEKFDNSKMIDDIVHWDMEFHKQLFMIAGEKTGNKNYAEWWRLNSEDLHEYFCNGWERIFSSKERVSEFKNLQKSIYKAIRYKKPTAAYKATVKNFSLLFVHLVGSLYNEPE